MAGTIILRHSLAAAAISFFAATAVFTTPPTGASEAPTESQRLFDFMEEIFKKAVSRSPEFQTFLGDRFDIREFHHAILGQSGLTLDLLESQVNAWVEAKLLN